MIFWSLQVRDPEKKGPIMSGIEESVPSGSDDKAPGDDNGRLWKWLLALHIFVATTYYSAYIVEHWLWPLLCALASMIAQVSGML